MKCDICGRHMQIEFIAVIKPTDETIKNPGNKSVLFYQNRCTNPSCEKYKQEINLSPAQPVILENWPIF